MASDLLSVGSLRLQGKRAVCIYNYKATMNDELNLKLDDVVIITQCSEDETWLEGTLDGLTGWFPSNYVQIMHDDNAAIEQSDNQNGTDHDIHERPDESTRIKYLNELKKTEEAFLNEMNRFMSTVVLHLQSNTDILSPSLSQQLTSCIQDLINLHQAFNSKLKEIPENTDAKIGHLMLLIAPQFEQVYSSYAKNNPRFADMINKNNQELVKHFETSLTHLNSPLIVSTTSPINICIYITKLLAAPFKHIESYVKILKEIHRYSEDYHIDRGDVQRCVDFYSDLSASIYELRKKKEFELDLLSSKIVGNLDEAVFKSAEILFISSVLIVDQDGNKKDRILVLLPQCLVVLIEKKPAVEYEFEYKIPFLNANNSVIQIKKVSNLELNEMGGSMNGNLVSNKYCFELVDGLVLQTSLNNFNTPSSAHNISLNSLLISCSTQYDLRVWLDTLTNLLSNVKKSKQVAKPTSIVKQESNLSLNRQINNSNGKLNNSISSNGPSNHNNLSGVNGSFSSSQQPHATAKPKTYSFRPHTPLIPHFQLPNDSSPQTATGLSDTTNSSTLKRFMYKKPKLSEPSGKYHGADDDLKLLNVIESFCKAKQQPRQSINVQDMIVSAISKSSILPTASKIGAGDSPIHEANNIQNYVGSTNQVEPAVKQADLNKLADEKIQLETNMQYLMTELKEHKQSNKELRLLISSLQKQLESERNSRRKLEIFIRKQLKTVNLANDELSPQTQKNGSLNHHLINVEHESSI